MGMGGVQRTLKFVKYLPKFGWRPYVLTDTPRVYFARDGGLLNDLTPGTYEIFRTKRSGTKNLMTDENTFLFKSERARKYFSALGQSFLFPDTKRMWKNKAVKLAEEIIAKNEIDLIYATAPPYTDFLIGYELKLKYNIPLVLDYRDLWLDCLNNIYVTPLHRKINMKLEREVLSLADKVVCINSRVKERILENYPVKSPDDIIPITQGFDAQDFKTEHAGEKRKKMRFTYAGSFLYYYTPKYFLEALHRLFVQHPELKDKIEACFVGTFPDEYISLIKELNLEDAVSITGYLEHSDCVKYLMESDVLWMMINKTNVSDMHSTGKLFEYFGARKPILACVPDGVAKKSLKEYGAAKICEPDNSEMIADSILELYSLYEKNALPVPDESVVKKYDRENLTHELAGVFDLVIKSKPHKENKTRELAPL
jgi:glycosyltransferase involved in cell wall biosynthesis